MQKTLVKDSEGDFVLAVRHFKHIRQHTKKEKDQEIAIASKV